MKVNGKPISYPASKIHKKMSKLAPIPVAKTTILSGTGIITNYDSNHDTYTISALNPLPMPKIQAGVGIDTFYDANSNTYTIQQQPSNSVPSISRVESKPIFMVGLPKSISPENVDQTAIHLQDMMADYHVVVLRNSTDNYTAKLFSEQSTETMDIKDIKQYIDQKMKS